MKKVGIAYHPLNARVPELTRKLSAILQAHGLEYWQCSAWDTMELRKLFPCTDLIFTVGGDGTILRVAQALDGNPIPIAGINLGQLGFLTEIQPDDGSEKLLTLLAGKGWHDERAMLDAELQQTVNGQKQTMQFHALNDVVMARGAIARIIEVTASIDGAAVDTYKADGALVASATGSTGYALAAGGPILNPKSADMLLVPILPHVSLQHPLVLNPTSVITLKLSTTSPATLSIDGHISIELFDGSSVTVRSSTKRTRFLRIDPPGYFYASLSRKLKRTTV
ncbi:MAG: NAD(+)/NADH kinase [Dehalococcoidia bacterium]|nr:NAD(+)/NADH kinase [Dehalococcoidia bacterium]